MPRAQISIKLDEDLLTRVDKLAKVIGTNRTAIIERAIKNDLPEQEAFERSMANPAVRAIHKQITRPGILQAIAKLVDHDLSAEQIDEIIEKAPRQRERGKHRQTEQKTKRVTKSEDR